VLFLGHASVYWHHSEEPKKKILADVLFEAYSMMRWFFWIEMSCLTVCLIV
jgi:hypothetical protein